MGLRHTVYDINTGYKQKTNRHTYSQDVLLIIFHHLYHSVSIDSVRRVCIYQRGNQKYTQRSFKHTHKTKYRLTRTPLKTSGTRRVNLVTNPEICHE
jgi:hypothetical protein